MQLSVCHNKLWIEIDWIVKSVVYLSVRNMKKSRLSAGVLQQQTIATFQNINSIQRPLMCSCTNVNESRQE
jgi:hypothetical protein